MLSFSQYTGIIKRLLYTNHPKIDGYVNSFKQNKYIFFEIRKIELSEKYNQIWDKVSKITGKAFDTLLVFEEKYLSTKLNYYDDKNKKYFLGKNVPVENLNGVCIAVMVLDSICKIAKAFPHKKSWNSVNTTKRKRKSRPHPWRHINLFFFFLWWWWSELLKFCWKSIENLNTL